ncbi:MAG: ABC transporter ATP-binding protein [Phycisphaerales bacterium]|nr:ABC transporter ATP-binding protein [Phycisphaerales bacterium]
MKGQPIISAVGLTKVFLDFWRRARVKAVNDIDFTVEPGEIFGLLGPNGSGKSTTIKMLLGLLYPTRGRITIFGKPPEDVATKSRIGYLPEESYSYKFLNARETLDYYATLFQIPRRERKKRIEELLEMVGLRSAARRPVGEYSKGMARRIGLAQALINDPDLLILDEPTSGLDPIGSKLVKDIIVRLGQTYKKTILLSSHLLADVEEVCGRVAILFGGRVQVAGTMQEVLSRRDQMQITCDRLKPETVREIQELIQRREGKQIDIATPKDRLESLFLRIVEEAHAARVETAGSQPVGEIAGFLGQDAGGRAVLESLTKPDEIARPASAAAPAATSVDANVITTLTAPSPAGATEERQAAAPQADRALLDTLLDESQGKKKS